MLKSNKGMFAKSLFITGCNRGIGLELVKQLAGKTQHLFAGCRAPDEAVELKEISCQHKNVVLLKLDVTNGETITQAVKQISDIVGDSGLNCLINNAAIMDKYLPLSDVTSNDLANVFNVNTIAPSILVQSCLPLLRRASLLVLEDHMAIACASVINMSTVFASIQENTTGKNYGYRMSKTALNMLTRNLSNELRCDNILTVSIHPGWVKTGMGGPNAQLTTSTSVEGMIQVLSGLTRDDHGEFYSWNGSKIPW